MPQNDPNAVPAWRREQCRDQGKPERRWDSVKERSQSNMDIDKDDTHRDLMEHWPKYDIAAANLHKLKKNQSSHNTNQSICCKETYGNSHMNTPRSQISVSPKNRKSLFQVKQENKQSKKQMCKMFWIGLCATIYVIYLRKYILYLDATSIY